MYFDDDYTNDYYRGLPEEICPMAYMIPYLYPLDEFDDGSVDDDMMRQPPYSVVSLLRLLESKSPQSFTQFEKYRVPRFFLRRIYRSFIGYILRNVNFVEPLPRPINQYAESILNKILSIRPLFENVFAFFGVPVNITRNILRNVVIFVLGNLPFPSHVPGGRVSEQTAE